MNDLKGAELDEKYKAILEKLGGDQGILGKIFFQANNKISNASILYRIVQMIDKEKWVSMSSDLSDNNTIILCVNLTSAVLLSHGTRDEY